MYTGDGNSPNIKPVLIVPNEEDPEDPDPEMEDVDRDPNSDPTCSEGTIEFKITQFSKMKDKILSLPVYIRGLPWLVIIWRVEPHASEQNFCTLVHIMCHMAN